LIKAPHCVRLTLKLYLSRTYDKLRTCGLGLGALHQRNPAVVPKPSTAGDASCGVAVVVDMASEVHHHFCLVPVHS
jgi:hypothetical protein